MKKKLGDFTLFEIRQICHDKSLDCGQCPLGVTGEICTPHFKGLDGEIEIKLKCNCCNGSGKYIDQATDLEVECLECKKNV